MALNVSTATPGNITGVTTATPGKITGVSVANPRPITSVGNSNGSQTTSYTNPATVAVADPYGASLLASSQALLKSIQAQQEVMAPTPNFKAINSAATARANKDVNPIYTKYLNDFLGQQAQQQATQKAVEEQSVQNAKDTLKQTQDANAVTGARTTQDTATKEAQAAEATDWRQTDQGGQYDIDRVAQAIAQAKAGTTGSGVAGGTAQASQDKFNTTESRQATQDAETKANTELAKARTFEDLSTSNINAVSAEGKSEKVAQFNLSSFIQGQGIDLKNKQQQLEIDRQNRVAQVQGQFVKSGFQDFFNKISNPAQKAAFAKAYGSYL